MDSGQDSSALGGSGASSGPSAAVVLTNTFVQIGAGATTLQIIIALPSIPPTLITTIIIEIVLWVSHLMVALRCPPARLLLLANINTMQGQHVHHHHQLHHNK